MYRSRRLNSISTLVGSYVLAGTNTRTCDSIDVSLFDMVSVQVGYADKVGVPNLIVTVEGSADGTNWSAISTLNDDYLQLKIERIVVEHATKYVRVKIAITTGTSISVTWVNLEAIT